MDSFLSHEWSGLALALPAAVLAWAAFLVGCRVQHRALRWLARGSAGFLAAAATLLTFGALFHLGTRALDIGTHAAPGALVDVDGHRMHVLAEGPTGAGPTVVWIGGGYAQGLGSYPLHARTREFARSVLYDHAGTGWSESGPYPRTVEREVADLKRLLDASGERGPYVLAGHSFGGLLAINFAARHPADTAGLVLLDATPVGSAMLAASSPQVAYLRSLMRTAALVHAFGLSSFITTAGGFFVPASHEKTFLEHLDALGPMRDAFRANERRVSSSIAAASIIPAFMAGAEANLAQAPGVLGDLPMTVVYTDTLDVASWSEERRAELRKSVNSDAEWKQRLEQVERANREVQRLSTRARRIAPPAGSTHGFPQEHPDFCVQLIREMLQHARAPSERR